MKNILNVIEKNINILDLLINITYDYALFFRNSMFSINNTINLINIIF